MRKLHIAVIVIGTIFILLGAFHTNIWFDESYTVAIVNHSFSEIWSIGGNDVHPILYYWILKIINLIFGTNILIYRLFTVIPLIILAILGFTHIRKDFDEKTGLIFSFLILFLPIMTRYASELRMYSFAILFTSVTAIYAYRLYDNKFTNKNIIIFAIFSLCSAYTHYYGLMASGLINLILFIYLVKNFKEKKSEFFKFIVFAIFQIVLYIPWLMCFLTQLGNVSDGFWIQLSFPKTLIEIVNMQYCSKLNEYCSFIFAVALYIYLGFLLHKEIKAKNNLKAPILALSIYVSIIVCALIISLIMQSVILLNRYLLVVTGLLVFFISFLLSREKNKYIVILICTLLLIMSIVNNIMFIKENYAVSNYELIDFINENIKEDDLLLYNNDLSGFTVSARLKDNIQYFYNQYNWNVEEAYKAYGPNMEVIYDLDKLEDYSGRIWMIYSDDDSMVNEIQEKYKVKVIDKKDIDIAYNGYRYRFILIEKI